MYYIRVIYCRNGYSNWDYRRSELVAVGEHDYFGKKMNVLPIPTIGRGLCYKLELSNGTIPTDSQKPLMALKSTVQGMDKLKGFSLMIASRNTWQGVVYGEKYKKAISIVTGNLLSGLIAFVKIELEESIWNYNNGEGNFDICMQENKKNNCKSIFDTSTLQDDTRYTNKYYRIKHLFTIYFVKLQLIVYQIKRK